MLTRKQREEMFSPENVEKRRRRFLTNRCESCGHSHTAHADGMCRWSYFERTCKCEGFVNNVQFDS